MRSMGRTPKPAERPAPGRMLLARRAFSTAPPANAIGNQAALRLLRNAHIDRHSQTPPALEFDPPGSRHEREADRVADRVLRMSAPSDIGDRGASTVNEARPGPSGHAEGMLQREFAPASGQQLTAAPRSVNDTLRTPGRPLDTATRAFMEPRFGRDFSRVQVHTDAKAAESARAVNATAYTVGPDVVFAAGAFQPHIDSGRRLLAHELTHVVQQTRFGAARMQRYEGPEHQDIGDRYARDLLAFLQTPEGVKWATDRGLNASSLVAEMQADPMLHGARIQLPPQVNAETGTVEHRELTPGEIISLMGDLYGSVDELANAPASQLRDLLAVMQGERAGTAPDAAQRYERITGGRYLSLAQRNDTHFAPRNRAEWRRLHEAAIAEAQAAGREQSESRFQHALLTDAAAGHFLTDAYASGHLFDKSQVLAEITLYLSAHPAQTRNPQMQTYVGIIGFAGKLPQLVLKNIHDRMNREGFVVHNARGMSWRTFGDDYLAIAQETQRIAALAVFESRQQIYAAHGGASPNPDDVEALMPNDDTVQRATLQAIGYIPNAVAEVESLIYRNRSLAPTQFGPIVGAIVESNLSTIGNPARERQINDMLETARRTGVQAPIAPSFTVLSWP